MKHESGKVALACAIGAGIGALIALEMTDLFWGIGPIIGFFVGYLSYRARDVVSAIPRAYRATRRVTREIQRPKIPTNFLSLWFWISVSALSLIVDVLMTSALVQLCHQSIQDVEILAQHLSLEIVGLLAFVVFVCPFIAFSVSVEDEHDGESVKVSGYCIARKMARIFFPPFLWFYFIPKYSLLGLWYAIKYTALFIVHTMPRFTKEVFIYIHSDRRLICGVDAGLGAIVGFLAGSVIVGMLAGGVLGLINYEMVSKRWLKLEVK